ncbi:MAG: hypothetical protein AB7I30_15530 [Isosphaeraceae bacterium]
MPIPPGPSRPGLALLPNVTCPHCWGKFAPEDVLWASEHRELLGDPILGAQQQRRFLPSRFTPEGKALDERGLPCSTLACPLCHLGVPRILLEIEPLFLSILGTPTSGKSYFLAAMTSTLRRVLYERFAVNFTDVDASYNALLTAFENSLFMNDKPDEVIPLNTLIQKTQTVGTAYDTVTISGQSINYPRPFLFAVRAHERHPTPGLSRVICLYDNAGEHFLPGEDRTDTPVTRHMALSRVLFFVFDPTQDPRLQPHCRSGSNGTPRAGQFYRQETVLNEAAARVRTYAGLPSDAKHHRPLIMILAKSDEWRHLLDSPPGPEPSKKSTDGVHALDGVEIAARSEMNKKFLTRYCPEVVAAAEDFCPDTTYVAVSALGDKIETHVESGKPGIRPRNIAPSWVTVPMLHALAKVDPRLIRRGRRPPGPGGSAKT